MVKSRSNIRRGAIRTVDYIYVDLGTGGLRMGCGNEGDDDCREIANYPEAQAGTPSLVPQAPSDVIYKPNDEGPAEPVGFGYATPRRSRQEVVVRKVKTALLPDPGSYGYAHSLLVAAADALGLRSIQQIPEDFLRLAVQHATKQCNGQPKKGWVFSVPQSYKINEVQNFRALIQNAGCNGEVYIHGESDCVVLSHKKGRNFFVAAAILDFGAGTTDVTTSEICFKPDGTPPTIKEVRPPLGFAIGGDLFDERFNEVLRMKLAIDMTPIEEQAFFDPFTDRFHRRSKPQWPTNFEPEEYPFRVPQSSESFTLTREDMANIMEPPINEMCQRIGNYLSGPEIELVVISGGNSEVPGLMPLLKAMLKKQNIISPEGQIVHLAGHSSNAVLHGLHYWINHPHLVKGRYAQVTLAQVVRRHCTELDGLGIQVPIEDGKESKFYDSADRIITEGEFIPDGFRAIDLYYDIDANAKTLTLDPILICVPNERSATHKFANRIWNFASECRPVGTVDLTSSLANIDINTLWRLPGKGKRRLWLRLIVEVGLDITFVVSWRPDGRQIKDNAKSTDVFSSRLTLNNLDLSTNRFVTDFRAPINKRDVSDSHISHDSLSDYLKRLRTTVTTAQEQPLTAVNQSEGSSSDNQSRKRRFSQAQIGQDAALTLPLPIKTMLSPQFPFQEHRSPYDLAHPVSLDQHQSPYTSLLSRIPFATSNTTPWPHSARLHQDRKGPQTKLLSGSPLSMHFPTFHNESTSIDMQAISVYNDGSIPRTDMPWLDTSKYPTSSISPVLPLQSSTQPPQSECGIGQSPMNSIKWKVTGPVMRGTDLCCDKVNDEWETATEVASPHEIEAMIERNFLMGKPQDTLHGLGLAGGWDDVIHE